MNRQGLLLRSAGRLLLTESSASFPLLFVLVFLGVGTPSQWFVLVVIRLAFTFGYLGWLFQPLRSLPELDRLDLLDNEALLDADQHIRDLPRHFCKVDLVGWTTMLLVGTGLGALGFGDSPPVGTATLTLFPLLLGAALLGVAPLIVPALATSLLDLQREFSVERVERKLRPRGKVHRLQRSTQISALSSTLSALLGLGMVVSLLLVDASRSDAAHTQALRVEVGLAHDRSPAAFLEQGFEILAFEQLPAPIQEAADRPRADDTATAITAHDLHADRVFAAAPLGRGQWLLAHSEVEHDAPLYLLGVVLFSILALIPLVLTARDRSQTFTAPIVAIDRAIVRLLDVGDVRGLGRVAPLSNDEVGSLAHGFNAMLDMLDELTTAAQSVAQGNLNVELVHPGELHDAFRGMLNHLHEMVTQIHETGLDLNRAATDILALTLEYENTTKRQSVAVGEVRSTLSSLTSSAAGITESAASVLDNAEQTLSTTDAMLAQINTLGVQAAGIEALSAIIREIADRSDLLALNGSLEAVRAGEAGRGFALVATEMRRLAERVTGSVSDVQTRVASINATGTATVAASEQSRVRAENTAEAAREISSLTLRQGQDTAQVSRAVQDMATVINSTTSASWQIRAAAQGLQSEAERLERLIGEFALFEERS